MPKQRTGLALKAQSTWVFYPEAGVYSWSGLVERPQQLHQADLAAESYAPVQLDSPTQVAALKGQLAQLLTIAGLDGVQLWAQRIAIEQIDRYPVVLAFRAHASQPEPDATLRVLQPVPPPMLGECALIWSAGAWHLAEKEVLGPEGRAIQRHLAEAITNLAAPATEWWSEQEARAVPPDDPLLLNYLADLAAQRQRRRAGPVRWETQWQTLRGLARELAEYYWIATTGQLRPAIVDKDTPAVIVPADALTQQIMRSLLNSQEYERQPEQRLATWQHPLPEQQNVTITISQADGETWNHMLDVLAQLGDEAVDTFCAVLAIALATNGSAALAQPFYLAPDDVLALCGRQESHRSYTPAQRTATIALMNLLARIQVSAVLPTKRRNRVYRMQGPILHLLAETIGEYVLDTGEIIWQKRLVNLGRWAAIAPQLSNQTVLMLRKVLSYHPQRDRFVKRLGRYLTLQFATGGVLELTMGQLIKQAGIPVDRNMPNRTRQTIEQALAELVNDGILGSATLIVESSPVWSARQERIAVCGRGWWHDYEQQCWQLAPPPLIGGFLNAGEPV